MSFIHSNLFFIHFHRNRYLDDYTATMMGAGGKSWRSLGALVALMVLMVLTSLTHAGNSHFLADSLQCEPSH